MDDLYFILWPPNISSVYVNGSTIQYLNDQSVSYSNEMLSPGQVICTWNSKTDYLRSGNSPSLPLLKANNIYHCNIDIDSDNEMPIQIQINFWDKQRTLLNSYHGTDFPLEFKVPFGTSSYDINLINLNHTWIHFKSLIISENASIDRVLKKNFGKHHRWFHIPSLNESSLNNIHIKVNTGSRQILPVQIMDGNDSEQIVVFTDGKNIDKLINSLKDYLRSKPIFQIIIDAGLGYYHLPKEFIIDFEKNLADLRYRRNK